MRRGLLVIAASILLLESTAHAACRGDCRTSDGGLVFIQREEGFSPVPYKDSAGHWTIGVGHLIQPGEKFPVPLVGEAVTELLRRDVGKAERVLARSVVVDLDQHHVDPLVSLIFNCGPVISKSTLVKILNTGRHDAACMRFTDWRFADGKPILLGRRKREQAICLLGAD